MAVSERRIAWMPVLVTLNGIFVITIMVVVSSFQSTISTLDNLETLRSTLILQQSKTLDDLKLSKLKRELAGMGYSVDFEKPDSLEKASPNEMADGTFRLVAWGPDPGIFSSKRIVGDLVLSNWKVVSSRAFVLRVPWIDF